MKEETNTEFKAVIPAPSLKAVLKVILSVNDEATFRVSPDGISIVVADVANASMVDVTLNRSAFAVLDVGGCCEVAIDVETLLNMVMVADDHDMVLLERSEDEKTLIISYGYFGYELELLKIIRGLAAMPVIPDTVSVTMSGRKFVRMVAAVEAVGSNHARIGVAVDGEIFMEAVMVSGIPKRTNRVSMVIPSPSTETKTRASLQVLAYLQGIAEVVPYHGTVGMKIGTDLPLRVEFQCCDGGRVKYMLAPRIESD